MRLRADLRDFIVGLLLGLTLLGATRPAPVLAHDSQTWFNPLTWDTPGDIDYRIDDEVPGGDGSPFEDRIHDARHRWNGQCCIGSFLYIDSGNGTHAYGPPCNWEDEGVDIWIFYRNVTPDTFAQLCVVNHPQQGFSDVQAARIVFDAGPPGYTWHTNDTNPGPGEVWVEESATHEFGHVTGVYVGGNPDLGSNLGHWPAAPSNQCAFGGNESDWTMCGLQYIGRAYGVPLEPHDIDTFQDFY